jgi:pimeloyl-ACP methyl ester carboxylesterase
MLSVANTTRKPSLLHRASSIVLRTKNNNLQSIAEPEYVNLAELTEVQSGILPMRPLPSAKPKNWKGIGNEVPKVDKKDLSRLQPPGSQIHDPWKDPLKNGSTSSLHRIPSTNDKTPRPLDFGLSEGFDRFPSEMIPKPLGSTNSPTPKKKGFSAYSYSYSYSYSRSPTASSSQKTDRPSSPNPPSGPSFGLALQQASHAECEPGTTSDLLSIVLGRQHSSRPWQYALNYADFSLPVKIYWGQEDDKISEKSVRWMEKTMVAGVDLLVLEGEGHNLMTSSGVMLSVFQSLREEVTAAALGPQPDLRLY